ncbi:MAG: FtsQ-type POTRA domain-containing protein [Rhodospirillaceae bacterium]|jgi:cell division protein FtsQ|nr:FtsQ-type POTRA domain-containing protein [Rhodospirillaceae bacterium]MBT5666498.1 FtsQ-type POTRA domain-containing protein [Rhodospirillaceae bacterium]MBT5810970.1 FtsQ-type POTRA domain-containing protein [Rhodospirillaceae bacterium]
MRRLNPTARKQVKRRRVLPRWTRPAVIALAALSLSGVVAFGGYWAVKSGQVAAITERVENTVMTATAAAGLVIEDVLVEGRNEATRKQIMFALDARRDAPILAYDPHAARARLLRLGWIADATVERRFPGTIYVRILERRAMAIWQRKGRFVLVDNNGGVIGREGLDRYGHLKVIVGADAPKHAAQLLHMLAGAPNMSKRVTAAVWVGGRRWNLRLEDKIDVRLPEQNPETAWNKLIELDQNHALLDRDITTVDLRIPNRLIVRMRPEAAQKRRDGNT